MNKQSIVPEKPKVSIIIPTYNRIEFLQKTIDSVMSQKGIEFECIVVDDGSVDNTGHVISKTFGSAIRYVWQENRGVSFARNRGAGLAKGKYLAFLDSDDLWKPDKLITQYEFLESNSQFDVCLAYSEPVDSKGNKLSQLPYGYNYKEDEITIGSIIRNGFGLASGSMLMICKDVFLENGGYDETIANGEDIDFIFRLLGSGHRIGLIKRILGQIRLHKKTQTLHLSRTRFEKSYQDHRNIFKKLSKETEDEAVRLLASLTILRELILLASYNLLENDYKEYERVISEMEFDSCSKNEIKQILISVIEFFTNALFQEYQDQEPVLGKLKLMINEFIKYYRFTKTEVSDLLINASVWCGRNSNMIQRRKTIKFVINEIWKTPYLLFKKSVMKNVIWIFLEPFVNFVLFRYISWKFR